MRNSVKLGKNGPLVSRVGFGCMGMSGTYDADRNDAESIKTIRAAYEAGINLFDTADIYGEGHSETLLGKALFESLQKKRNSIIIATKCGFVSIPDGGFYIDVSPKHILESCQNSLTRLGVDYIDLYYLHRLPKGGIDELRNSLDALISLLKEGKIKHVGLSEADAKSIRFAHQYFIEKGLPEAFIAVQSEFSIFVQEPLKNNVFITCYELGLSFIPFSPLCRGMLTEKMQAEIKFDQGDFRLELPMFQGENFKANLAIRDKLAQFAVTKNCTLPQLGLAWLMAQGENIIPIPGTKHIDNLNNNLGSLSVELIPEDLSNIQKIMKCEIIKGTRYPWDLFALMNIESAEPQSVDNNDSELVLQAEFN